MIKKNPQTDRLNFNFRRKPKGKSLTRWLIPTRFQFPASKSQGIRPLQRKNHQNFSRGECAMSQLHSWQWWSFSGSVPQTPLHTPPTKTLPPPQTIKSLANSLHWKFQSLDIQSYRSQTVRPYHRKCLATLLDNVVNCPRVSPRLKYQDAFYIQTHTCYFNSKPSKRSTIPSSLHIEKTY